MAQPSLRPRGRTLGGAKLRDRLLLLAIVLLLLLVGLGATAHSTASQRDAAMAEIAQRFDPARDHVYGFLVAAVADDHVAARQHLADAHGLLGGDPAFADSLSDLEASAAASIDGAGDEEALHDAVTLVLDDLAAAEQAATAVVSDTGSRLRLLIWTVFALAVGLVGAAGACLRRWLTVPLAEIAAAADEVSEGNLYRPIPERGSVELAALARTVERMRARTVGLLDEARRATEALEHQGATVATVRRELAPSGQRLPETARFAAVLQPAEGVLAGDWYDCVDLGNGRVAVAVVDVSGHGPCAGVFALRAKHLMLAAFDDQRAPGDVLNWLASHIGDTGERFLSAFIMELDTTTGACRWASAGHPPAMLVRSGGIEELGATGPILGPLPGYWETRSAQLGRGDYLLAYTDGLVEARSGDEEFGRERLVSILEANAREKPDAVIAQCISELQRFTRGSAADDITIVGLSLESIFDGPAPPRPSGPAGRALAALFR